MKKNSTIVFVCHYFPPETNVGIRRVSFWANYFISKGIDIIVITSKKDDSQSLYEFIDKRVKVFEFSIFSISEVVPNDIDSVTNNDKNTREIKKRKIHGFLTQFKRKVINPIFGQLVEHRLISIFGLMLKIKLGFHKEFIGQLPHSETFIVSTSPPWPSHLLGKFLAASKGCPFIADYRDPFSNNHIFSSYFNKIESYIDHYICYSSDSVFTVSNSWKKYYKVFNKKTYLLRNGYDSDMFDFSMKKSFEISRDEIVLNYFGSIEHPGRVPDELLNYLLDTTLNIVVNFYGSCSLIQEFINKNKRVSAKIVLHGQVPYNDAINIMKYSSINIVSENMTGNTLSHKGLIPTKVYEYLACLRPIIAVVNMNSDMAVILKESGLLIHDIDKPIDFDFIFSIQNLSNLNLNPNINYIKSLSRQHVADDFLKILDGISNEN